MALITVYGNHFQFALICKNYLIITPSALSHFKIGYHLQSAQRMTLDRTPATVSNRGSNGFP